MAKVRKRRRRQKFLNRKRLWVIAGILVILIASGIAFAHSRQAADKSPHYHTMTVAKEDNFVLTGKVAANERQVLALPDGKLQNLNVADGDHVVRGETILTTTYTASQDSGDQPASASSNNGDDNSDSDASSQSSTTDSQDNASQPTSPNVSTVQQTNTLTAPYSGYVSVDQSKQGQPIITLYSDSLQFAGEVSEYDYNKVRNGTDLHVTALASHQKEVTPVNYVAMIPAKDSGNTAKYKVTASLKSSRFIIGQTLRATVSQDGVRLPKSAVVKKHVYIVDDDGRVRESQISGHAVNGSFVATAGVYSGDRVVTNPGHHLKNKMRINNDD